MAAILDRDRDTASGGTEAPYLPAAARNVRRPRRASSGQPPLCEVRMGSLNVIKDTGRKYLASSGNDEETEAGSTVCTGDEVEKRQGTEDGGGIQDAACMRRRKE